MRPRMLWISSLLTVLYSPFVFAAKDVPDGPVIETTVNLRTHSLFPPYVDQELQNRWFSFGADSYVNTNKHIRLTQDRPSQMGWVWSRLPLTISGYQIDVEFRIHGKASHLYGDGLAMWLTTTRAVEGPVFGFSDNFEGLGIFLDTFANGRHAYTFPRVSAMLGDGKKHYDKDTDGEKTELAGCSVTNNIRRTDIATKLRLTYIKPGYLDLKVHYKGWDEWTTCFTLENVTLPANPFLGFTAETGELSDSHDIISVSTTNAYIKTHHPLKAEAFRRKNGTFWRSLFYFILKCTFFGIICMVGLVAWRAYSSTKTGRAGAMPWTSNKRF